MTIHPSQRILEAFRRHFGEPALLVQGPGRVNLIGEHTDYNLGYVLPAAVDLGIWLAISPRPDQICRFHSVDLDETFETKLDTLAKSPARWPNYLTGVLSEMIREGYAPRGVDCAFGGNLPIGSGMSSSAALECGFALGVNTLFDLGYEPIALAGLGKRVENHFVGVNCGIMDQFASVMGREGHLIRLDCRDLSYEYVPFQRTDVCVVLCDTQVRRALATSEYNTRRGQCEAGVAILARHHPQVASLRDVTQAMLDEHRGEFDETIHQRCSYVVQENQRVLDACEALTRNDFRAFGALMNASHAGLSRDYAVSCAELDCLAEAAQAIPGVLGSRMMGAGFGGCTINLVEESALPAFREGMGKVFRTTLEKPEAIHVCRPAGGARILDPQACLKS